MSSSRILVVDASGSNSSLPITHQAELMEIFSKPYQVQVRAKRVSGRQTFFRTLDGLKDQSGHYVGLHVVGHGWGTASGKAEFTFLHRQRSVDLTEDAHLAHFEGLGVN